MRAAARAARRGHHRPRHGQSRSAAAAARHRETGRSRAEARRARLFAVEGHSGPAHARRRIITAAASGWRSIPRAKSSSRWDRRKGSPASPPRSPRRATSCSRPTRATRSTPSASSSPARRSARCRPRPTSIISKASSARSPITVPRPSVLVVNYPSNPTAETVDLAFYERLVAWAQREQGLDHLRPRLFGALLRRQPDRLDPAGQGREGRRGRVHLAVARPIRWPAGGSGFAVGNKQLIAAMTRVKSYLDYGAFTPIQAAACAALNGPQDIVEKNRQLYHKRRDVLVESFGRAGWDIPCPRASMFAWAPLPPALAHLGSLEFSKQLLTHAQVAVAPGVGYGENGEGLRAHRDGRERATAAPGGAQREALSAIDGGQHPRRIGRADPHAA